MIDNSIIQTTSAWPFVEARKLIKERKKIYEKKGKETKIAIPSQDNVVKRKACCKFNFLFSSRFVSTKSIPINAVTDADDRKVLLFSSYKN